MSGEDFVFDPIADKVGDLKYTEPAQAIWFGMKSMVGYLEAFAIRRRRLVAECSDARSTSWDLDTTIVE